MIYVKIYDTKPKIIAICDIELIGKYFEEGKVNIKVDEKFYKGEKYREGEVKKLIKKLKEDYCSFNIVGKKSVDIAIEFGIIDRKNILYIQGIPIALALT